MGQNLGLLWSTAELAEDDENFPSRIRNWFNEVQKYVFGAKWSVKTGHYSQVSIELIFKSDNFAIVTQSGIKVYFMENIEVHLDL